MVAKKGDHCGNDRPNASNAPDWRITARVTLSFGSSGQRLSCAAPLPQNWIRASCTNSRRRASNITTFSRIVFSTPKLAGSLIIGAPAERLGLFREGPTVDYDKLNERLTHLEGQVSRLLIALCCALGIITVFIFYDRQPYFFDEGLSPVLLRMFVTVAASFMAGWPIMRWVVGKRL